MNLMDSRSGKPSARYSERSKFSQRNKKDDTKSDVNPYGDFDIVQKSIDKPIGSSRREKSKIVAMIDNSSRTSKKHNKSYSDSVDEDNLAR